MSFGQERKDNMLSMISRGIVVSVVGSLIIASALIDDGLCECERG